MTEQPDRRARWLVRLGLGLLAVLVALGFGVTTARTEASFGPHLARYAVTTDGLVVVDLGPLGTLQVDSPLPLALGVGITVQEIPDSLTEVDDATTLAALSGDLQRYVQFFSAPQTTVSDVARSLVTDALQRAGLALVALVGAWGLGRWALGPDRRTELRTVWGAHAGRIAAGTAIVLVVGTVATSSIGPGGHVEESQPVSHVFDGTALEGARVTGRLGGVIDTYGSKVLAAYRTNQDFYERADVALARAWDERAATQSADAARTSVAPAPGTAPTRGPSSATVGSAPPTSAPTGASTTEPTAEPTTEPTTEPTIGSDLTVGGGPTSGPTGAPTRVPRDEDLVTLVVVSDLHCNVGMAPLITTLVERSGAAAVLDAGDTTMNGTAVEQYCTSTFASAVSRGVDLVVSPGNHDSAQSAREYGKAGARILAGKVVEVDGLRILGDADPNETRAGAATQSRGESARDAGRRLRDVACDDEDRVDLLLIHTPAVGEQALASGCVPAQVSGHLHRRTDPTQLGSGIRYISSSTAGATLGQPTVGPLHGTAEMTVLRWDPETRLFVDYQVVQVKKDATAVVQPRAPWPTIVVPPQGVPLPIGGPVAY